jgi:adenylylsulfate kinase
MFLQLNRGLTLWLTGLSGSGKSTIAKALYERLSSYTGMRMEILDGDEIREHLSRDLGFTKEERLINIERIAFLAGKISKHHVLVIVPVIAPYKEARDKARSLSENFVEVFVDSSLEEVIKRDVKGLYKKALTGEIKNFTGISDPYEIPENPDIKIKTEKISVQESVDHIIQYLLQQNYLASSSSAPSR